VSILLKTFAMMIWGRNPLPFPHCCRLTRSHRRRADLADPDLLLALALIDGRPGAAGGKNPHGPRHARHGENPRVAGLMGVDSNKVIIATFALGAALAAVAGVMWGANYASIQFSMGFLPGLKAFCAAVLGGIGNIYGAMLGGICWA
jgi:branched-chain amino acid transport system permease protein